MGWVRATADASNVRREERLPRRRELEPAEDLDEELELDEEQELDEELLEKLDEKPPLGEEEVPEGGPAPKGDHHEGGGAERSTGSVRARMPPGEAEDHVAEEAGEVLHHLWARSRG